MQRDAVIQLPPDGVEESRDCRCHSFAVCAVDVGCAEYHERPESTGSLVVERHPVNCILPAARAPSAAISASPEVLAK